METRELLALGVFGEGSRLSLRIAMLLERGRGFSTQVAKARMAVSMAMLAACVAAASLAPRMVALAEDNLRFAATSIRPVEPQPPGSQFMGIAPGPEGGLRARQVPLGFLIGYAYNGDGPRMPMEGLPDWAARDQYDVVATPEPAPNPRAPNPPTKDQLREMTRNMLADRFKLATHRESREMFVYALTVAKGGSKLRREWPAPPADPEGTLCNADRKPMCTFTKKATIDALVAFLGRLDRPVVDRTGLEGDFDFRLKFDTTDCRDAPDCVAVRDAVQDQLGLKIEESKGPVDVLVIDHAEKPEFER
jgi:uncharacterized protein (TIGR03435 family)